nr:MAG TPA: hypothetical protein [Caudoviricetes sp.]DAL85030.1 MAG TPA: hypothetical protein [Caudoviricetes sp.]
MSEKGGEKIDSEEENTDTDGDKRIVSKAVEVAWNERRIL